MADLIPDDQRFPSALFTLARQAHQEAVRRAKQDAASRRKAAHNAATDSATAAWHRLVGEEIAPPRFRTKHIGKAPLDSWPELHFDLEGHTFRLHKMATTVNVWNNVTAYDGTSPVLTAWNGGADHFDLLDPQAPTDDGGRWRCIRNLRELGAFLEERGW